MKLGNLRLKYLLNLVNKLVLVLIMLLNLILKLSIVNICLLICNKIRTIQFQRGQVWLYDIKY